MRYILDIDEAQKAKLECIRSARGLRSMAETVRQLIEQAPYRYTTAQQEIDNGGRPQKGRFQLERPSADAPTQHSPPQAGERPRKAPALHFPKAAPGSRLKGAKK